MDFIKHVIIPVISLTLVFAVLIPPALIILFWWMTWCLNVAHRMGVL